MDAHRKADRVADDLLRQIVSGELKVGSLLPKEAELAERYDVNRSVIREAIKLLEVHRLVRPVRRRGTEVLDPYQTLSPEVLEAMLVPSPGQIDRDRLADLLEIRAALDVQMSTLAARRRTDGDLRALEVALEDVRRTTQSIEEFDEAVDRFMACVARATHNRIFEMLVSWNRQVSRELREIFRTARVAGAPYAAGLELLLDLIRRQDAGSATELLTAYYEWATPRMLAAAALRAGVPLDSIITETRT